MKEKEMYYYCTRLFPGWDLYCLRNYCSLLIVARDIVGFDLVLITFVRFSEKLFRVLLICVN